MLKTVDTEEDLIEDYITNPINESCDKDMEFFIKHTQTHITRVRENVSTICDELTKRGVEHDASKFTEEEACLLATYCPKLRKTTYGSDEYKGFLEYCKPALDLHYQRNRHHPEYFKNGFKDMNLVDLLELLSDWRAACQNHADGNIIESITINQARFGYSDEIKEMLKATVRYLGWLDE